ncbi:MAG TPA: aspartate aminotransferase [Candidatus Magasanikbacteria bacterium]|nr:aspartate aminotransferase [Candidatus Magasanikbacteria bacterium]
MNLDLIKIEPSATVAINSLALQKKQAGERVYNLSVGEPMINTPEVIKSAATKALAENKTHYPPVSGLVELKNEAVTWFNKNFQANYNNNEVLVTAGGKFGIYLGLQSLVKTGDEVLIISPYWVSYPEMVKIFDGSPKIVETSEKNDWKVSISDLQKQVSNKTKILILNNAGNPTGVLYNKEEIAKILEFAKENNLVIISDEVYSGLVYDNQVFFSCASFTDYKDRLVVIQSCSKNLAMTGWRVGFVFAPVEVIKILTNLTSQSTSGVTSISQYSALAGLENIDMISVEINSEMQKRRDFFVNTFNKLFKTNLQAPASALYCFISMSAFGIDEIDSIKFCERVLSEANVAMVPGIAFGKEGYVRCSFGENIQELDQALLKLAEYLQK